ncbi:hypothetical protein DOTSEDRAFT_29865 [Dothistroma septosporum NZE10]|uniref:Uncharacterized protein n=1 Tax=Dothistroma septosporum (strain NZE10 / CBS 128990) TaxID=675120 RepID=N1PZI2_DOTSN|nr:hypothetical protein DOTSEDRAFT_29865 [Dothistroma septosporum NZE10]
MWIWNAYQIISCPKTTTQLSSEAEQAFITGRYLYMDASRYSKYQGMIKMFDAASSAADIGVWALEEGRVYFNDADGPAYFHENIRNMISFNARVQSCERFCGFLTDLEPHAEEKWTSFHYGIKDSDLDSTPGTGVWKESQIADRSALMRDRVAIHTIATTMLNASVLRLAAVLPHWTCNYFGEPLQVRWSYFNAPLRRVMELLMENVDDYVVTSYNTDPTNAAVRVKEEVKYATALSRMGDRHWP